MKKHIQMSYTWSEILERAQHENYLCYGCFAQHLYTVQRP